MRPRSGDQFESLEGAHDFVMLLSETLAEAKQELENDVQREPISSRRLDALRIALYNLDKLELHVNRAGRILNDLRSLRRLLFEERGRMSVVQFAGVRQENVPSLLGPHGDQTQSGTSVQKSLAT